ncbi:MAG: isoleucyl-tRNA synthetase, partial [Myxococcota bacterium]
LVVVPCDDDQKDSVHLCDYPQVDSALINKDLEAQITAVRSVVGMGRALRERHRLKIRQPLRRVTVVNHEPGVCLMLQHHADLICEELNVKGLATRANDTELAEVSFKANFKRLGRRFGRQMRDAAAAISALTSADWQTLQGGGTVEILGQEITAEDVMVTRTPRGDVVIETEGAMTVALDTELDATLRSEGLSREVTSRVQRLRKDTGLEVTDRINLVLVTQDADLLDALDTHGAAIAAEVLAVSVSQSGETAHEVDLDGIALSIGLTKA